MGLAGFTGLHPSVVRDKGLSARAGHDPILRDLLGVPGAAPGIDRGLGLVQPAAVADDERLPLVVYVAADQWTHDDRLAVGRDVNKSLKTHFIKIRPLIRNTAPTPCAALFHSEIHDDMLRFFTKKSEIPLRGMKVVAQGEGGVGNCAM